MFVTKQKTVYVVLLTLGVLGTVAGLMAYRSFAAEAAPGSKEREDRLQPLLQARLDAAKEELESRKLEFEAGRGTLDILLGAARRTLHAQKELSAKKADQIAALEAYQEVTKYIEETVKKWSDAGRVAIHDHKEAQYYRLEAEIMLERAKAN
jgi:hypothetical protein